MHPGAASFGASSCAGKHGIIRAANGQRNRISSQEYVIRVTDHESRACHTLNGYRPLVKLPAGRDRADIASFFTMLHEFKPDSPYHHFMPSMMGRNRTWRT
ncbi:MAG: hypothetical protein WB341_12965 [Terracidiphilus sp.]